MPKFTFAVDEEDFDEHIRLSIRGYSELWNDALSFSEYFVEDETTVVDLGCSTGKLLKEMKKHNDNHSSNCVYQGIEIEEDFFPELIDSDNLKFYKVDVCKFDWGRATKPYSLITSIFTLQFISKRDRGGIIEQIYNALMVGGAFIFAEKLLSSDALLEEMMTFCYYNWKQQHFSEKQILEKEIQLRHMMKLMTHDQMMVMLKQAGFTTTQRFWQNYNFVGYIALKNEN